jgi:hypothetical protein
MDYFDADVAYFVGLIVAEDNSSNRATTAESS